MISALIGGVMIGLAAVLFLLLNGRILGVSGIVGGLVNGSSGAKWRFAFVFGLLFTGAVATFKFPHLIGEPITLSSLRLIIAGLLVGFGTNIGNGCTSGHGVCGIARISKRSFVATLVFMAAGMATVFVLRKMGGL